MCITSKTNRRLESLLAKDNQKHFGWLRGSIQFLVWLRQMIHHTRGDRCIGFSPCMRHELESP